MGLMDSAIDRYKRQRKYRQLSRKYKSSYAFVGIGGHSINNLYPVLDYLKVPLKYIVTNSAETARVINESDGYALAINDYGQVLEDPEIKGVFISASPRSHYKLITQALEKGKMVFVEKPPCFSGEELEHLIRLCERTSGQVLVGLQKRYTPAYSILKKKASGIRHYSMRYCTGSYPEGNALMDLYIHPIDIACYLFGEAELASVIDDKQTLLLQLKHKNGINGTLELSTAYSWQNAIEWLAVVCKNGIYEVNTPGQLAYENKPVVIGDIPLEKVIKFVPVKEILFNQNSFLPVLQHNNVYVNGFYSELENFIDICEGKGGKNLSGLETLVSTYKLLDQLK